MNEEEAESPPEWADEVIVDSTGHQVDWQLGWQRILVTGSRTWAGVKMDKDGKITWPRRLSPQQHWQFNTEYAMLTGLIEEIRQGFSSAVLMHGAASGADALAQKWANDHTPRALIAVESYPADWEHHSPSCESAGCKTLLAGETRCKRAGYIRNQLMVDKLRPNIDVVLAFWDGVSPGTKMCIDLAERAGLQVFKLIG